MKTQIKFGIRRLSKGRARARYFAGYALREKENGDYRIVNGPVKSSRRAARAAYCAKFGKNPPYLRYATTIIAAASDAVGPDRIYRGRHLVGVFWSTAA